MLAPEPMSRATPQPENGCWIGRKAGRFRGGRWLAGAFAAMPQCGDSHRRARVPASDISQARVSIEVEARRRLRDLRLAFEPDCDTECGYRMRCRGVAQCMRWYSLTGPNFSLDTCSARCPVRGPNSDRPQSSAATTGWLKAYSVTAELFSTPLGPVALPFKTAGRRRSTARSPKNAA